MGSSSPPQGCSQGSWHSTFQPSTALECDPAVQSCPDELLCQVGVTGKPRGAGRKILHLGAAAWSKCVQLWGHTPGSSLGGKLRLVQWWPSPGLLHYLSPLSPSTMPLHVPVPPKAGVTQRLLSLQGCLEPCPMTHPHPTRGAPRRR